MQIVSAISISDDGTAEIIINQRPCDHSLIAAVDLPNQLISVLLCLAALLL